MGPSPLGDGKGPCRLVESRETELQWGRRLLATERSFKRGTSVLASVASMGPSPLGDGKTGTDSERAAALASFNGAVASWRRKGPMASMLATVRTSLQWGRRLLATERARSKSEAIIRRSEVASERAGYCEVLWTWRIYAVSESHSVSSSVFVGFLLLLALRAGLVRGRITGPLAPAMSRAAIRISQSMHCQITTAWRSG